MREKCLEYGEPVMDTGYVGAIRCPESGRLDYMDDLPNEVRFTIWNEAKRRHGLRHVHPPRRNPRFIPAPGGVAVVEESTLAFSVK